MFNSRDGKSFLAIILLFFAIIVSAFFIVIPWYKADRYFVEFEYHGVIKAIEYRDGYRGVPHILLDSSWHLLTLGELKFEKHIAVGDSIAKKRGRQIEVFKKVNGKYLLEGVY